MVAVMEFRDVVRRRRMVRRYADRALPDGLAEELASVALRAPSAGFTQGVSLLLLESAAERDLFWTAVAPAGTASAWARSLRTAPLLILLWTNQTSYLDRYAEPDKGWTDRDRARWSAPYWWVDAGMAGMLTLLAAVDQRLGAGFFGIPADRIEAVRAAFGVPPEELSVGVVSVGYPHPDEQPSGSPTRRPRKAASSLVHRGSWASVREDGRNL
jgi:nitroreductase